MRLGEVMTTDVEVIGSNASLKEAAAKMKDLDVGLIPVCEGDELKGTLTDRDITVRATAEGRSPSKTKCPTSCPKRSLIVLKIRKSKKP